MNSKFRHYLKIEFSKDPEEADVDKIKYLLEQHFQILDYSGGTSKEY